MLAFKVTTKTKSLVPTLLAWLSTALACGGGEADDGSTPVEPGDPEWSHAHCDERLAFPVAAQNDDPGETEVVTFGDGARDVRMPAGVIEWLSEQGWQQQHDDWHRIRRWDQGCGVSNATPEGPDGVAGTSDDCESATVLRDEGLWRAPLQENAPGDGYSFLVMHRHMLEGARQAFPDHPELFAGWREVPRGEDHPENPTPWRSIRWSSSQLEAIDKLEHIEDHLDELPDEDALARYIQAPFIWTETNPTAFQSDGTAGLHFMFHAQWGVAGSPVNLGNGHGVVENRVFWQLHGWIDDVWERYRVAKGIGNDDEAYVAEMKAQCWEMHVLGEAIDGGH